jgi:hypothetical protein
MSTADRADHFSLLPDPEQFLALRDKALLQARPAMRLALADPLLALGSCSSTNPDNLLLTAPAYTRAVVAALKILSEQMSAIRSALWLLPHISLLRVLAQDELDEPSAAEAIDVFELQSLVSLCDATVAYALSSSTTSFVTQWHAALVDQISRKTSAAVDDLQAVVLDLFAQARSPKPSVYLVRTLQYLLSSIFRHSDPPAADYERWLDVVRPFQNAAPDLFLALIPIIAQHLSGNAKYERMKNATASDLSTVKPAQADEKGELLLRQLLAFAPAENSDDVFLPPQRIVIVLQTLQNWVRSEDVQLGDPVLMQLSRLSTTMASLLQDMSGPHWDLLFDIAEMNIEVRLAQFDGSSLTRASTRIGLTRFLFPDCFTPVNFWRLLKTYARPIRRCGKAVRLA